MSRVSREALCRAIDALRAMDGKRKEQLGDEVFRVQPHDSGVAPAPGRQAGQGSHCGWRQTAVADRGLRCERFSI